MSDNHGANYAQRASRSNEIYSDYDNVSPLQDQLAEVPEAISVDGPIGVDHVNWLLKMCKIVQESPITSLKQCSSSLFALLFQRLFSNIANLELEPNTQEKRLWNIQRVLEELAFNLGNADLSYISAQEIVNLNEEHISMLIRVFIQIALYALFPQEEETHTAPEEDQVSNADSATKTQQLVSSWKREVVHPLHATRAAPPVVTRPAVRPLSDELADMRARIFHLDEMLQTPKKRETSRRRGPSADYRHAGKVALPSPSYVLARTIDTEARDMRAEQLRTMRVIKEAQQEVRAAVVRAASNAHVQIAQQSRLDTARIRHDTRDMIKMVRDENRQYLAAYSNVLASARNDIDRHRALVDANTAFLFDANKRSVAEAKAVARQTATQLSRHGDRRVQRFQDCATSWARGTVACQ